MNRREIAKELIRRGDSGLAKEVLSLYIKSDKEEVSALSSFPNLSMVERVARNAIDLGQWLIGMGKDIETIETFHKKENIKEEFADKKSLEVLERIEKLIEEFRKTIYDK